MKPIPPQPGQESVWDYPRPPACEPSDRHVVIEFADIILADTTRAYRVLETSHPPVYYVPPDDIQMQYLEITTRSTFCEWKGHARYYTLSVGDRAELNAAWFYPDPTPSFAAMRNYIAFYPSKMDRCTLDGEAVQAQPGDFYGGWITQDVVGPFKGGLGSWGW